MQVVSNNFHLFKYIPWIFKAFKIKLASFLSTRVHLDFKGGNQVICTITEMWEIFILFLYFSLENQIYKRFKVLKPKLFWMCSRNTILILQNYHISMCDSYQVFVRTICSDFFGRGKTKKMFWLQMFKEIPFY